MNPLVAAALFFIIWWLCFFIALPIGVRPHDGLSAGHDTGAPEKPDLLRKALWATGGAIVLWAVALFVLNAVYYSR